MQRVFASRQADESSISSNGMPSSIVDRFESVIEHHKQTDNLLSIHRSDSNANERRNTVLSSQAINDISENRNRQITAEYGNSYAEEEADRVTGLQSKMILTSTAGELMTSAIDMKLMTSLMVTKYRHTDAVDENDQVDQIDEQLSLADCLTVFDGIEMSACTAVAKPLPRYSHRKSRLFVSSLEKQPSMPSEVMASVQTIKSQTLMSSFQSDTQISVKSYIMQDDSIDLFHRVKLEAFDHIFTGMTDDAVTCIAVDGNRYAIGLESGTVLELVLTNKIEAFRHSMEGTISSVALTDSLIFLTDDKCITIKKTNNKSGKKTIPIDGKVIGIHTINPTTVVVIMEGGMTTVRQKSKMMMFDGSIESKVSFSLVAVAFTALNTSNCCYVATAFINLVILSVISIEDGKILHHTKHPIDGLVTSVSIFGTKTRYLTVSYGSSIKIMKINDTDYTLTLSTINDAYKPVIWCQVMDDRLLLCVDHQQTMEVFSLDKMFNGSLVNEKFYSKTTLEEAMFEGRQGKAVQALLQSSDSLSDADKMIVSRYMSGRCLRQAKQLDLCCGTGLWQYHLMAMDNLLDSLAQKKKHIDALRVSNSVFLGRVVSTAAERKSIQERLPALVLDYIDENKNEADEEDMGRLLSISLESMAIADVAGDAFGMIQSRFDDELFYQQFSFLAKNRTIKSIDIDTLCDHVDSLEVDAVVCLLQGYNLDSTGSADMILGKIASIVKRKNAWSILYKISIVSPENSVMLLLTLLIAKVIGNGDANITIKNCLAELKERHTINLAFINDDREPLLRLTWYLKTVLAYGQLKSTVKILMSSVGDLSINLQKVFDITLDWLSMPTTFMAFSEISTQLYFCLMLDACNNTMYITDAKRAEILKMLTKINNISDSPSRCLVAILSRVEGWQNAALSLVSKPWQDGSLWHNYKPLARDRFEDMLIQASESFTSDMRATLAQLSFRNG